LPPASAGFLFGLLFNPEDGEDRFLQNMRHSQNHVVLKPRIPYFSVTAVGTSNPTYFMTKKKNMSLPDICSLF
jgi:hypothetical protein